MENTPKKSWKRKFLDAVLEILGELVIAVIFCAIGAGIMILLGKAEMLETVDSKLLVLLGALAVLAVFGVLFTVIAIVRKIKRR